MIGHGLLEIMAFLTTLRCWGLCHKKDIQPWALRQYVAQRLDWSAIYDNCYCISRCHLHDKTYCMDRYHADALKPVADRSWYRPNRGDPRVNY